MPTTRNTAVAGYDGSSPLPRPAASARAGIAPMTLTAAVVVAPYIALGAGIWLAWGSRITLADLLLAAAFYVVTGLGVTVGFRSTPPPHSSACSNVWTGPQTCTGTQATSSSTIAR